MTQPYQFQTETIDRVVNDFGGRAIIASDPGLGKSCTALWCQKALQAHGPLVIVCPATLKIHWRREAWKHAGIRAVILSGEVPPKQGLRRVTDDAYIINYDILATGVPGGSLKGTEWLPRSWGAELSKIKPSMVILDEISRIRNQNTKSFHACKMLSRGAPYVLALGGTAGVENRAAELWPTLRIVKPSLFPCFLDYAREYCDLKQDITGRWVAKGSTNTRQLNRTLINNCMVRYRKQDVLDQLPSKTHTIIPFTLSPAARREYDEAHEDYIRWLFTNRSGGFVNTWIKSDQTEQFSKLTALKQLVGKAKLSFVKQWTEEFLAEGQKLLMFGHHKAFLNHLNDEFGRQSVIVTGDIVGTRRQASIDRFNQDPSCRLFLGNTDASGYGWNCTSASNVAFAELGWSPGPHLQAIDRCHGMFRGTGAPVNIWWLICENTIEDYLVKLIYRKMKDVSTIIDGKESQEFSILEELSKEMMAKGTGRKR